MAFVEGAHLALAQAQVRTRARLELGRRWYRSVRGQEGSVVGVAAVEIDHRELDHQEIDQQEVVHKRAHAKNEVLPNSCRNKSPH